MTHNSSARLWIALAGLGALASLLGAFAFQYIGGLAPCQLCLYQRWPHAACALLAAGIFGLERAGAQRRFAPRLALRLLAVLGALIALVGAGIALFHTGVEQHWWEGLASCTGGNALAGLGSGDLLNFELSLAPPARCDEIPWQMFGLSMAAWNGLFSLGFTALWVQGARRL